MTHSCVVVIVIKILQIKKKTEAENLHVKMEGPTLKSTV